MRPTKQARRSPPARVLATVRRFIARSCPWETALGLAGVQRAEDVRWRDVVDAAEEQGTEPPAAEAEWTALWSLSRDTIANAAGELARRAAEGKDVVAACRLLLPIEGGEAWVPRGPESGIGDDAGGLDEVAIERLSPAQRHEMAEWGVKALEMRNAIERLMREAHGSTG